MEVKKRKIEKKETGSSREYWNFAEPPDLVLKVENKEYHVHKRILTEVSPVFKVMLESENFREKNLRKIELPGKRAEDMHVLLNLLYPFGHQITGKSFYCVTEVRD